jgi:hypothetical protein
MVLNGITQNQIINAGQETDGVLDIIFLSSAPNSTMSQTYNMSVIIVVTQSCPPCQYKTCTCLSSPLNPSVFGQPVTFTARVTGESGTPSGTVTFYDGSTSLGTGTLNSSGLAAFTTSALPVGSHTVKASYGGNGNYLSSSDSLTQTVNPVKTDTSTTIISNGNPSLFGQSVTFTATVKTAGAITPTGTVTFKEGSATLGTGTLNGSAIATYKISSLSVSGSPHAITAVYGGDAKYNGSSSGALQQTVNKDGTTSLLVNPCSSVKAGSNVTFNATVSPVAPGSGAPAGTVTFKEGSTVLGTATLDSCGKATFCTTKLPVGTHYITAGYDGNSNFSGSTSNTVKQVIAVR